MHVVWPSPKSGGQGNIFPVKQKGSGMNIYMCVCVCVCVCFVLYIYICVCVCIFIYIYIYIYHYLSEVINNPKTEGIKATVGERLLQEQL